MKLFLVGDFPKNDKIDGGVQGVLVNLINELVNRPEIELVLIALTTDCDLTKFESKCKTYKLNFRTSFIQAKKEFYKITQNEKPDIIHLQDVVPGVLLYRKEYQKIFVVTQHAISSKETLWQVSLKRKLLFKLKELIEKYYLNKIQNIIFISEYNKNIYFEGNSINKSLNYQLIPNPVNDIFFQTPISSISKNKNELYFVGEIKKRKGLHILIQALHILKQEGVNCKLHVIGGFKENKYKKEITDLIKTLDLDESILFCGWKNQIEIIEYSKNIPVFVLPSFQETLPLSIAEAMCQGKIAVATDVCGIPEMIEDGISGYLFPPGDFIKLANVLNNIFLNIGQQISISNKASTVGKKFNSKNIVNKTIDLYKSLAT